MRIGWFTFWLTIFIFLIAGIVYYGFWRSSEHKAQLFTKEVTAAVNKFVENTYMECTFPDGNAYYVKRGITIYAPTKDTSFFRCQKYIINIYDESKIKKIDDPQSRDFSITLYKHEGISLKGKKWVENNTFWTEDSIVKMYTYRDGTILPWYSYNTDNTFIEQPDLSCDRVPKNNE